MASQPGPLGTPPEYLRQPQAVVQFEKRLEAELRGKGLPPAFVMGGKPVLVARFLVARGYDVEKAIKVRGGAAAAPSRPRADGAHWPLRHRR